ncbi:divalent-cation tolerance protein CutA [Leptolyngbya iicbica]|uniref:Divalent-cation tolerance protein CutA n=2 Tax=Cyanophyceae TaxID=3028117 RepID=A0A4Q7E4K0_9CYAN|nr:divalent-cation tolerance protein CutA [Leptolyngbya sp. LK]RZM77203.1 divalent-cation tolerance protein CutA [Leptolyngbya sp. LK]
MATYGIVLVTVDTQESAQEIAQALVGDRLAACVNLYPIHSVYTWEGKVEQAAEWQLIIKTDLALFPKIETALGMLHPYDVPEILAIPIHQGSEPYMAWLAHNTQSSG